MAKKIARAVHPNAGVEAWYRARLQQIIADMNTSMLVHIRASWKRAEPSLFAHDATPKGVNDLDRTLRDWGKRWSARLDAMSAELASKFASRSFSATQVAMAASFKAAGFTIAFKPTVKSKAAYRAVAHENVNLIKSIPAQYLKDVETQVWQSVMRGGDMGTLAQGITAKYGVAHRRAALIARDQNNKAKAVIENVRRQELGITEAIWMHSGGGREPRPEHVAFSGKRYKLEKGAYLEGKHVWPGSEINCRCVSKAVIPGFE